MVAFRSSKMVDYEVYQRAFDGLSGFRFEPGFHLIKWIGTLLGNVQFWGFVIYAFLCVYLKLFFIKKYQNVLWQCLLVYMASTIVTQDMVAIRAGVAGSFMLFAIDFKQKGKRGKMYTMLVLSVMFHYSALACFIIPFLDNDKPCRRFYLLSLLFSHLLALMGIFLNKYIGILNSIGALEAVVSMQVERDEPMNFLNLMQIGNILVCVIFWFNVSKMQKNYRDSLIYLKLYTVGICVMPLLALMMAMAIRLQELFFVVLIVLIPMGFSTIFKKKVLNNYLLILYSLIVLYFIINTNVYWGVMP